MTFNHISNSLIQQTGLVVQQYMSERLAEEIHLFTYQKVQVNII